MDGSLFDRIIIIDNGINYKTTLIRESFHNMCHKWVELSNYDVQGKDLWGLTYESVCGDDVEDGGIYYSLSKEEAVSRFVEVSALLGFDLKGDWHNEVHA